MGLMIKTEPACYTGGKYCRKREVVHRASRFMSYRRAQLGRRQCRGEKDGLVGRKITPCVIVLSSCRLARIIVCDNIAMERE